MEYFTALYEEFHTYATYYENCFYNSCCFVDTKWIEFFVLQTKAIKDISRKHNLHHMTNFEHRQHGHGQE